MTLTTNPLTYNSYVSQIAAMAVYETTTSGSVVVGVDTPFNTIIPQMLNYAELRIQRDLDLLPTQVTNSTYSLTSSTNTLNISVADFVTIQTVAYVNSTATIPLLPVSKEFIQNVYNDSSYTAAPVYFAMYGNATDEAENTYQKILVGPYPDQSYNLLLTGTIRIPTLYNYANDTDCATKTTFISAQLPDLLIMASMIYISAYQRNFGRESDDPQMAQSYENQYKTLLQSAMGEEYRKKFQASAWTSQSSSPVATPTRG